MNQRRIFLLVLALLIFLGLVSRKIQFIPPETGDALWAMSVFAFLRILSPRMSYLGTAVLSLAISFAIEFSQLIHYPWLDSVRNTWTGHMLLGQGFLWEDLVAYTIGIILMYVLCRLASGRSFNEVPR